eukprot:CCRYP_020497-RC/>CCRYP_020497-RC protein AED:0.28 eAED:0.28 QI:0/-1/0/1/-1/0/1/0/110
MTLKELGHCQPPTSMQTYKSTAEGIINGKVQSKQTKAMDMCFHWLRGCSVNQKQCCFYWHPGQLNYADYWTKHHSPSRHCYMRKEFLTPFTQLIELLKAMTAKSYTARVC